MSLLLAGMYSLFTPQPSFDRPLKVTLTSIVAETAVEYG